MAGPRVVVLADDLIWATRLGSILVGVGAEPIAARTSEQFGRALASADRVVVDMTSLSYDGVRAIEEAARRGLPVIAVAGHDDVPLRKRALAAGAERVYAYRKIFDDGPATLGSWIAPGSEVAPA